MAISSSNLKLTQVQAVVKVTGGDTDTGSIDIDTDIKKATETASSPTVNITRIHWYCDTGASIAITRNTVVIATLTGHGYTDWYGFVENTQNDQDIDFSITGGTATCILELAKVSGFGPQQHQGADGDLG
jgi:hypothetical protein